MRGRDDRQMSHELLQRSAQQTADLDSRAGRTELVTYAKFFPWICLAVAFSTALPFLILDTNDSFFTPTIALWMSATAGLLLISSIIAFRFLSTDPKHEARSQIIFGGLLLAVIAACNATLILDSHDVRHSGSAIIPMICAALLYPRLFGVLVLGLPQLGVLAWFASEANWESSWAFGFFSTLGGTMTALLTFYLRQAYFRRHHALLAERDSYIEALQRESAERALLQEQVLTERHLTTLGRLAGGIAHDLNNILVPIMGNAAMLEESVHTSTHKHQAREVLSAATRARNLTQQLDFFYVRGKGKFETLDLNQLLADLCPIVWRTFPQGIDIDLNVQDKPLYLRANRVVLQDLLTNLLLNAGNAAMPENSVNIKVAPSAVPPDHFTPPPERTFCAVTISDGGEPITAEQREALLKHDKLGDRGIGLLGARDKAEAFGAYLDFDAADGSNHFRLFLPVQKPETTQPDNNDPHVSAAVAPEVLVVDDEPSVRRVTSELLSRAGFVVRECDSGEAALVEIGNHLPDAIVMDLRMPGIGGRAAAENIRKQNLNIPIVICTGFAGDAQGWLSKLPNCALLQKPYDTKDLIGAVNSLLSLEFAAG